MSDKHWIGVDLDGTLARDDTTRAKPSDIGPPVPEMVMRVKRWLAIGGEVRIVTARANERGAKKFGMTVADQVAQIQAWCVEHVGTALQVQCHKDYLMSELWDDRAVTVVPNTGLRCCGTPAQIDEDGLYVTLAAGQEVLP